MRITKENIHKFIDGSEMDCSGKGITHIEYIPEGITHLYFYNNKLTELPKLPESLKYLYCYSNKLTSLPRLPESLRNISSFNNNLPYKVTIDNIKEHNKLIKRKEILKKICK
jgi:Leucine-rich repeat (LRR) protein